VFQREKNCCGADNQFGGLELLHMVSTPVSKNQTKTRSDFLESVPEQKLEFICLKNRTQNQNPCSIKCRTRIEISEKKKKKTGTRGLMGS